LIRLINREKSPKSPKQYLLLNNQRKIFIRTVISLSAVLMDALGNIIG
jgi:hypothetical protein